MSDKEIAELEKQLLHLQIDFNRRASVITSQLREIRQRNIESDWITTDIREVDNSQEQFEDAQEEHLTTNISDRTYRIEVGDWVKVTNSYRYSQKNKVGKVYKFNKNRDRLWLETKSGEIIQRAPWNVVKTTEPDN